jgi:uncharacterized protein YdaT
MAKGKNYSVGPHDDGWQVKRDGAERASSVHDTKSDALKAGKNLAKDSGGELRIKGQDGKIQNSNTHGPHDPNPPKDRKH